MGVAQCLVVTGTAMFHHKSFLFFCTLSVSTTSPQSYFHNFGNQGTYTSVRHGSSDQQHHQPPPGYSRPSPTYTQPARPAPAPAVKSFYHAPIAKPYVHHHHQPRPSYHQPAQYAAAPPHGPG